MDQPPDYFRQEKDESAMNASPQNYASLPYRNSKTDPLQIDSTSFSDAGALLGITMRPGRKMRSMTGGFWNRSLDDDLQVIREWSPHVVLEFGRHYDSGYDDREVKQKSAEEISKFSLYRSFTCNDHEFLCSWERTAFLQTCDWMRIGLQNDRDPMRVLMISERGLLRAGLAAAHVLFFAGIEPEKIPNLLEEMRPGSFDTVRQHALFEASLNNINEGGKK